MANKINIPFESVFNGALVLTEFAEASKYVDGKQVEGEKDGFRARVVAIQDSLTDFNIRVDEISPEIVKVGNEAIAESNDKGKFLFVKVVDGFVKPYVGRDSRIAYSVKAKSIILAGK